MAFLKYFCFNYNIDLDTALKKTPEKVDEKQLPKSTVMERSPTWGASPVPAVVVWVPWGEAPGQKKHEGLGLGRTLPPVLQQETEFVTQTSWHTVPRCPKLIQLEM